MTAPGWTAPGATGWPGAVEDARRAHSLSLVPAAVAAWLAGLCGLLWGWWVALLLGLAAIAVGVAWLRVFGHRVLRGRIGELGRDGAWALLACGLIVVVSLAPALHAAETDPLRAEADRGVHATLHVELVERPRPVYSDGFAGERGGASSVVVAARVLAAGVDGRSIQPGGRVVLIGPVEHWAKLLPQQEIVATVQLAPARTGELTVAAGYARGPPDRIADAPGWQRVAESMRAALRAACEVLDEEPAGLLPGLVVGDTSALPQRVIEEFRASGLAHLTAVSGANLAILCGAVLLALRALRVGPRTAATVAGLVLLGFVILAGPEPSVLRAGVMGAVGLLALALGRGRSALPALAFAVTVLVLYDPGMAVSFGFALSVLATAALVLLAPWWAERMVRRGVPRGIAEALAIPAAAHLATAPVLAGMAGEVSLVSIAANLLAAPVIAPATVLGVLAAVTASVLPWLAEAFVWLAGPEVSWLIEVGRRAAAVPGATLSWPGGWWGGVTLAALAVVLVVFLRRRRLRALLVAAALGLLLVLVPLRDTLSGWPVDGWSMVACDVGQGDALVLSTAEPGRSVLVDAGPDPAAVDRCLSRLGVSRIPLVILSHLHADHIGGLAAVLEGRSVGAVAVGPGRSPSWAWRQVREDTARAGVPLVHLRAGARLSWPRLRIEVLGPVAPVSRESEEEVDGSDVNNTSVVLRAHTAAGRVLLTGDIEPAAQADLLASGQDLAAEVFKVPHHGSRYSLPEFFDAVRPRAAVISVGADNDYGHPSGVILRALDERGVLVSRTDQDGDTAVFPAADAAGPSLLGRGQTDER